MINRLEQTSGRRVSRETFDRLQDYVRALTTASGEQNLVSKSTLPGLWERHILDSAQLVQFESHAGAAWLDVGSGAGLPGIVIAMLTTGPMTLIEPRRLRAEFLTRVVGQLGLEERVLIVTQTIATFRGSADMITARAVAPLTKLLGMTIHVSRPDTIWVLPKGRQAKSELAEAQRSWHYQARTEPSCTDPQAAILVLSRVGKR